MKITVYDSQGSEMRKFRAEVLLSERNLLSLLSKLIVAEEAKIDQDSDTTLLRTTIARSSGQGWSWSVTAENDDVHYGGDVAALNFTDDSEIDALRALLRRRSVAE